MRGPSKFIRFMTSGIPVQISFDSDRLAAGNSFFGLCVVPLGRGPVGFQSVDTAGADISAGVLGAHRVRVRAPFHCSEAWCRYSHGVAWTAGDFPRHVAALHLAHQYEGAWSLDSLAGRASSPVHPETGRVMVPARAGALAPTLTRPGGWHSLPASGQLPSAGGPGVRRLRSQRGKA